MTLSFLVWATVPGCLGFQVPFDSGNVRRRDSVKWNFVSSRFPTGCGDVIPSPCNLVLKYLKPWPCCIDTQHVIEQMDH